MTSTFTEFFNEYLANMIDSKSHPYCIPIGIPLVLYIPRTIDPRKAIKIIKKHGYPLIEHVDYDIKNYPNPTNFPVFGQLYNVYRTYSFEQTEEGLNELGNALSKIPGADLNRLGRCIGYEGDIMPIVSVITPLKKKHLKYIGQLQGEIPEKDEKLFELMDHFGGCNDCWAAIRIYSLYFQGKINRSPSMEGPLYDGVENFTDDLLTILRSRWISWEGQSLDLDRSDISPGLIRHPNLMFAVPLYALNDLVIWLKDTEYAFAISSTWPLHYDLKEWCVRNIYLTGRCPKKGIFTGRTDMSIFASHNYLFGHVAEPGPEFMSMYATICIHCTETDDDFFSSLARIAKTIYRKDRKWYMETDLSEIFM